MEAAAEEEAAPGNTHPLILRLYSLIVTPRTTPPMPSISHHVFIHYFLHSLRFHSVTSELSLGIIVGSLIKPTLKIKQPLRNYESCMDASIILVRQLAHIWVSSFVLMDPNVIESNMLSIHV